MNNVFFVFIGGGLGSLSRYGIQYLTAPYYGYWATLLINCLGSFFIGGIFALTTSTPIKLLFITGFLGGFTTFSTLQLESLILLQEKQYMQYILYSFSSIILGLISVSLGYYLVKIFKG